MKTLSDLEDVLQSELNDTSSDMQTFLRYVVQMGVDEITGKTAWPSEVKTKTRTTVAGQAGYQLAIDHRKLKSVKVTVAGVDYFPTAILNEDQWNILVHQQVDQTGDIPVHFRILQGSVEFYPTPATDGNTITFDYYGIPRRYASSDFTDNVAGTVSLTLDSTAVTGSATAFLATDAGRYLVPTTGDGYYYKIASRASNTSLTLSRGYEGVTASGLSFIIGTVPELAIQFPEAMNCLYSYVAHHCWRKREEISATGGKARFYIDLYMEQLKELKIRAKDLIDSAHIEYIEYGESLQNPNDYPVIS